MRKRSLRERFIIYLSVSPSMVKKLYNDYNLKHFLVSYRYFKNLSSNNLEFLDWVEERQVKDPQFYLMMDSGAFSNFVAGKQVVKDSEYIDFIKKYGDCFDEVIMLDRQKPKINEEIYESLYKGISWYVDHTGGKPENYPKTFNLWKKEEKVGVAGDRSSDSNPITYVNMITKGRKTKESFDINTIAKLRKISNELKTKTHYFGTINNKILTGAQPHSTDISSTGAEIGQLMYLVKNDEGQYIKKWIHYKNPDLPKEVKEMLNKLSEKEAPSVARKIYNFKVLSKLEDLVNKGKFASKIDWDNLKEDVFEFEEDYFKDLKEGIVLPDLPYKTIYQVEGFKNNIRITFLGTKGEIEEENNDHKKNTSILIEHKHKNILIDFGYSHKGKFSDINPDILFITHAHPDHIGGLPETIDIPTVLSEKTLKLMNKYRFEDPHTEEKGSFFGWLEYEMIPVDHSILAPANGYILNIDNKKIGIFPDFLEIKELDKLKDLDLLIADGSSIRENIERKYNIGHQSMQNTLDMAKGLNIKKVVFIHFGKEVIKKGDENTLKELSSSVPFILANDGDSLKIEESLDFKTDQDLQESFEETKKELLKRGILNQDVKAITYIPHFVCLVGSKAKGIDDENSDWDIVIRKQNRDESVELLIRNYFGKDKNYHFIYSPTGPHGDYIPLFDLKLIPKPFELIKVEEDFKPMKLYTPPKMGSAYSFEEFYDINDLYDNWAKPYLDRGETLFVETKINGWRTTIHKLGNEKGMFFEGTERNRLEFFQKLKKIIENIDDDFILDGELVGRRKSNNEIIPRKDLALFNSDENIDCDSFTTSEGEEGYIDIVLFDIPYYNKDISDLPLIERKKYLKNFDKYKYFSIVKSIEVKDKESFLKAVKEVSEEQGSEGAVVKTANSKYTEEEIPDWAKFKKILEFKVKVIDKLETKDKNAFNYIVSYINDGKELELCKTMNTKIDANKGDILTLTAEEIIINDDLTISAQIPRVRDLDLSKKEPDKIQDIVYRAYKFGLLHCSDDVKKKFFEKYKLKEGWITYQGRRILINDMSDETTFGIRKSYASEKRKFIESNVSGEKHALRHWKSKEEMNTAIDNAIKEGILFSGKDQSGRTRNLFYNKSDRTLVICGEKGIFNSYRVDVPNPEGYIYKLTSNFKVGLGGKLQYERV